MPAMNAASPTVPRRWSVAVDGIRWLPRMIDKARMRERGALGPYLLGHSPVDTALLRRMGMTTDAFATLASAQPDDAAVLAALRARGFDEASVRDWSARFEQTWKTYIPLWDVDEGYTEPASRVAAAALAAFRIVEGPVMGLVRKVLKAP
ncbi:MAG: hypothetical protein NVSMB19_01530 [Vulcanimicrobiaceae bacterium]